MKCETCEANLIDYVHEELDAETSAEVAAHLATCSSCALASCQLRADLMGIATVVVERPRHEVREALRAKVEGEFSPSRAKGAGFGWARTLWQRPVPAYQAVLLAAASVLTLVAIQWEPSLHQGQSSHTPAPVIERVDATGPLHDPKLM